MLSILFGIVHTFGVIPDTSYDLLIFAVLYVGDAVMLSALRKR